MIAQISLTYLNDDTLAAMAAAYRQCHADLTAEGLTQYADEAADSLKAIEAEIEQRATKQWIIRNAKRGGLS